MQKKEILKRTHKSWISQNICLAFGLKEVKKLPILTQWLENSATQTIDAETEKRIEELRIDLENWVRNWNEEDLKLFFLGPLLRLIHFNDLETCRIFAERNLEAIIEVGAKGSGAFFESENEPQTYHLTGKADFILAEGWQEPISPFYCLQEYKREFGQDKDPFGQLLAEMVVARHANFTQHQITAPLFGGVISGQFWWFVVMDGYQYTTTSAFDATKKEDIAAIFKLLLSLKAQLLKRLG